MRYIADFHIHSRYSRACSPNLTLSNLGAWARTKGIDVLGTSDFTHPKWFNDIKERLEPAEAGLFRLKKGYEKEDGEGSYVAAPVPQGGRDVRFMLTTELSCIYKKDGKTRRVHLLVFAPGIEAVSKIIAELERRECNLASDGRPILGLDSREIVKIALEADPDCMVIPAHAWTPWFSVFGSESGFDTLEECFEDLTPQIHAIETGLSSDPPMNWRISALDEVMLISNSDAHSVRKLGREASVFELERLSYLSLIDVLRLRQRERLPYTIEFFPEEGKYHTDGHRTCNFVCEPEETARRKGLCPECGKAVTRGVLGRVHALADRPTGERPRGLGDFRHIVPLEELIAEVLGKTTAAKAVFETYRRMIEMAGPEFDILLGPDRGRVGGEFPPRLIEALARMRKGEVLVSPGYDGVFGKVRIFDKKAELQSRLDI